MAVRDTTTRALPQEARAWLARTLLFESMMTGLRKGEAVVAGDRIWTLTAPAQAGRSEEPAAA